MTTLPYGTWPSPLAAEDLASGHVVVVDLVVDGDRLVWTEARPAEGGRQAPVVWDAAGGARDLGPSWFNARTRVHEYGGAPIAAAHGAVWASRFEDQRIYRIDGPEPRPVTPPPDVTAGVRFADASFDVAGRRLLAVCETHGDGEPRNEIVAVDPTSGARTALVSGRDFVAAPRLAPDGRRLAWLAWDHPSMPWDAAELWVGDLRGGGLTDATRIGGGSGDAASSPVWADDGTLLASFDGGGFWEVHRWDGADLRRVSSFGADAGVPHWRLGSSALAPLEDGRVACVVVDRAVARLVVLTPTTGAVDDLDLPYVSIDGLRRFGSGVAFVGVRRDGTHSVVLWAPDAGATEVRTHTLTAVRPGDVPVPDEVVVATDDGEHAHAFFYPPTNAEVVGPADERPPLLVYAHGGPTGNVAPALTTSIAYWTTRGFAVVDVNYRGSTGYGRAYREQLLGLWGVLDVADVGAVARHLADTGRVDATRMAIRGGSAGGFTALAVLTSPDHPFACGSSFFGVADLTLLAEHTHKFESRYLDGLVGPLPAAAERYRERSPIHRVDQLSRPILVLQGLDDEVVPPEQAEAIVAAAARRGVPHAYLAFEGEGHGFRRAENVVAWLEAELAFYGRVMGFAPAGDLPMIELVGG